MFWKVIYNLIQGAQDMRSFINAATRKKIDYAELTSTLFESYFQMKKNKNKYLR